MVFLAAGRCQNVLLLSVVGLHLNQLFSFYNMPFVVINLIQINLTVFLVNITVQMYPCSEETDTGNPVL